MRRMLISMFVKTSGGIKKVQLYCVVLRKTGCAKISDSNNYRSFSVIIIEQSEISNSF